MLTPRPSEEIADMELCFSGIVQPLAFLFGPNATKIPTAYQKKLAEVCGCYRFNELFCFLVFLIFISHDLHSHS
jgi:hypothetical protein